MLGFLSCFLSKYPYLSFASVSFSRCAWVERSSEREKRRKKRKKERKKRKGKKKKEVERKKRDGKEAKKYNEFEIIFSPPKLST